MMVKNLRCNQRAQKLLHGECWLEQRQDLELKLCKCKSKVSLRPTKRWHLISWKIWPRTKCLGPALFLTCHILKQVAKSLWSLGSITGQDWNEVTCQAFQNIQFSETIIWKPTHVLLKLYQILSWLLTVDHAEWFDII